MSELTPIDQANNILKSIELAKNPIVEKELPWAKIQTVDSTTANT